MESCVVREVNVIRDHVAWRDAVSEALIDLDFRVAEDSPFQARMRMGSLRDTLVMDVQATPHSVTRDQARIRRSGVDDFVLLSRIKTGQARIAQNGRDAILNPGDFAIYDTNVPYLIDLASAFSMTICRIERNRFAPLVSDIGELTALAVKGDAGTGRIASMLINEVSSEIDAIGDLTARQMQDTMFGMVAAALTELHTGMGRPTSEPRHLLIQRALRVVEDELGNDHLSCEYVARRIGITGRYLRKVFADQGRSLSDIIWERRLIAAHSLLASPRVVQRSITSIAFDCGFKDSAHFSRAFRARFGISPRDLRCSL